MNKIGIYIFLCLSSFILFSCKKTSESIPSIYHWKSRFDPNDYEKKMLDTLDIQRIYMKYFDVTWDDISHKVLPVADLEMDTTFDLSRYHIVPCVFIKTEVFKNTDSARIEDLVNKVITKIQKKSEKYNCAYSEIQIDCDWNPSTRSRYFQFLKLFKNKIGQEKALSVTLRLYPYKYPELAGIPPADRAMLMCYNMSAIQDFDSHNSILDDTTLVSYLSPAHKYPLPMDVVLPVFEWTVIFGPDRKFLAISRSIDATTFLDTTLFEKYREQLYILKRDTFLQGQTFARGFYFRHESIPLSTLRRAQHLLTQYVPTTFEHRALFHLDSTYLSSYKSIDLHELIH